MSEAAVPHVPKAPVQPGEAERDSAADTGLVERAPADAIEPALVQSGNPPRTFAAEDR